MNSPILTKAWNLTAVVLAIAAIPFALQYTLCVPGGPGARCFNPVVQAGPV